MKRVIILISFFFFISSNILAQQDVKIEKTKFKTSQKKGFSDAIKNIRYGDYFYEMHNTANYSKALFYYKKAYEYNKNNPQLNYKIGVCIIETQNGEDASVFLQSAYDQNASLTTDLTYFLARSLHLTYHFEEAIKYYNQYIDNFLNDTIKVKKIDKFISECKNGLKFKANPTIVFISDMDNINSPSKDYCSMLTADGKKIYFTSRRPTITGNIDPDDNLYYEDIYMSVKDSNGWDTPFPVESLNTPYHDDVVGLSQDGNTLILYKDGDLYFCTLNGAEWSAPKAFPKEINSNKIESSACFSPDGKTLYFVRGKDIMHPESSNSDIYYSTQDEKGNWSDAKPLPSNINSPYDEDGLFLFADGKTLYFSSKGHNSMGGFDIFMTTINDDGTFADPENLGYPINSPYDDIYFVLEPSKSTGYFSSIRPETVGYMDIYQVKFIEQTLKHDTESNLIASSTSPNNETSLETDMFVISGKIVTDNTNIPLDAEIYIIDNNTNQVVYKTKANSQTGEYSITIPTGKNYGMTIRKDGYLFYSDNFDLVNTNKYEEVNKDVKLQTIEKNSTVTLKNVFFAFASADLQASSMPELNRIVDFLTQNSVLKIQLSGHTDNIGSYEQNMQLSQQRANSVKNYLVNKGITADRIVTAGYGYTQPIADNATEEGRKNNRRVELKILE